MISKYIGAVKRNSRGHLIGTAVLSLAVTMRVMLMLMRFVDLSVIGVIAFFLCPFLSMSLFWMGTASPVRSPMWLYRVIGIGVFVVGAHMGSSCCGLSAASFAAQGADGS